VTEDQELRPHAPSAKDEATSLASMRAPLR